MREIDIKDREYDIFHMFNDQWALSTSGESVEDYNTMTIGWGSLGTIWGGPHKGRSIATIYVTPARYTWEYLEKNDTFTISFFPEEYRKDLLYLGSHSGREGDKVSQTSLTPMECGPGVAFEEAELILVCKKIYSDAFQLEKTPEDIREGIYTRMPPHHFYIGEIVKALVP